MTASWRNVSVGYPQQFWYSAWGWEKQGRGWRGQEGPGKAGLVCCSEELPTGALETTVGARGLRCRPFTQP